MLTTSFGSRLFEQAHQAAVQGDQEMVSLIEERIDELAAQLWGS